MKHLFHIFINRQFAKKIREHLKNPIIQFDYQNEIENLKEQIKKLKKENAKEETIVKKKKQKKKLT